jgi:hypothetical protein
MPDLVPKQTLTSKPIRKDSNDIQQNMIVEEQNEENHDLDKSWVDFEEMEVEEARARRKDPRSFSTIFCYK